MFISKLRQNSQKYASNKFLIDIDNHLTYEQFYENTIKSANALLKIIQPNLNKPVVVLIDRNIESVAAFFTVAVTGNFYVPVDITQPLNRIKLILGNLNPDLIINTTTKANPPLDLPTVEYKQLLEDGVFDEGKILEIEKNIIDVDPLYAMFTSGSTGSPKGVLVSYRSVFDLMIQFQREFDFKEEDIFGNQAPFDFDVSVKDIYNALNVGATIVVIPKVNFSFPARLLDFLDEYKINIGIWAVSVLRIVENLKGFSKKTPKYLEKIMFSGEVMPNKILNYWRKHLPDTTFINLYGPTEITCNCTFHIVTETYEDHESLPIGIPFLNTRILLLDDNMHPVDSPNLHGEICVVGSSLALGYYNNKEFTDEAFVLNPSKHFYEEKIYKTGDIGYYNEDGLLMFLSRKDSQIKHMGHRIELGEIENNANAISLIDAAFCVYDEDEEKIVLFYQAKEENHRDLYREMLKQLPKYMVPNKFVFYEKFPLNKNNKIDRRKISSEYYANKNL